MLDELSGSEGITRELSLGEVVSKTFDLYRRDFTKYLILFLVVEAITGTLSEIIQHSIIIPTLPVHATSQQVLNALPGLFAAVTALIVLTLIVSLVFYPVAYGSSVKMASEAIKNRQTELGGSVQFTFSKLVSLWIVGIIVGIIVLLGLIALIIPGIILAIMFSLVIPVILIESSGALASLGRSRYLVSGRWLKTFALVLIFGIMLAIASAIAAAISGPFGSVSTIVSSLLSALYLPLIPIMITVYYYSNAARVVPPQPPTAPPSIQSGTRFCPSCGTPISSMATFCPNCGAKL